MRDELAAAAERDLLSCARVLVASLLDSLELDRRDGYRATAIRPGETFPEEEEEV